MNRNRNNVVALAARGAGGGAQGGAPADHRRAHGRRHRRGTISNIVDFGAFVDLDGIDGLIHISELSWTHINHPSEVLQVNQKVNVKVLDIDRDRQRISLGLKQTQEDPVAEDRRCASRGDVVEAASPRSSPVGAFVEIYEGTKPGPHSELANRHVERPDEVVSVGQHVSVKIIEIDSERRRLSLSIKRVEGEGRGQA